MLLPLLIGSVATLAMQQPDSAKSLTASQPAPFLVAVAFAPLPLFPALPAGAPAVERPAPSVMLAADAARPAAPGTDLLAALGVRPIAPRRAASHAPAMARVVAPSELAPTLADSVVVVKHARTMTIFLMGKPVRSYRVALGKNPVGDKTRRGDDRTPEGLFRIDWRNRQSQYFLSLHISYPDIRHLERASRIGVDPGGDIMIHGLPKRFASYGKDHLQWDWTNGCVAVSNQEMEELWRAIPDGTPIEIKP